MKNKSHVSKRWIVLPILFGLVITFSFEFNAQQGANPFADPSNLRVLPEDISIDQLRSTMIGFTQALGVRCSTCHMGEESQPLTEYDFSADDKEIKLVAHEMLKLVGTINEFIGNLDRGADHDFIEVSCQTCHRGQSVLALIE